VDPAPQMRELARLCNAVVDLVAVGDERGASSDSGIQLLGMHSAAPGCIGEQSHRPPVTIHLGPHVALGLSLASRLLEHLYRCLVAVDQIRVQQVIAQQVDHRLHGLTDAYAPCGQGVACQVTTELTQQGRGAVQRHSTRTQLVEHLTALLEAEADSWDGLHELANLLNNTVWVEDASSMFDYDVDLQVDVTEVKFVDAPMRGSLRAIDYSNDALTVIGKFEATASVEATFAFLLDGPHLGGCVVTEDKSVNFEVLITFEEPGGAELQAVEIELVRRMHKLDFGHVEPDYSDEDPTFERY